MKKLSEKLTDYLDKRNITPAQLAKMCGIDRSTIFQYVHGKRSLKIQEHLIQIMEKLSLTLTEKDDLLKTYQMELIGYDLYFQREKIDWFIRALPSLSDTTNFSVKINEEQISLLPSFHPGTITNRLELYQTMLTLLYAANKDSSEVKILMQPKDDSLLNLLLQPVFANSEIKITHILCLDTYSNSKTIDNISSIKTILRYFLLMQHYRPLYFYGHAEERFGTSNVFPYLFLTDFGALQISSDESTAILHTDQCTIQMLKKIFANIEVKCNKLGDIYSGLTGEVSWYTTFLEHANYEESFEMCSGLCSTQFWDRRLIETYINPMLPNIHELTTQFVSYCQNLLHFKQAGDVTVLMNPSNVLDFIKTGVFKEYPSIFFSKALLKEDRKIIIDRVLKACADGWYHIRFIDESFFPLQYRWEIISHYDTILIQHFRQEQFRTLLIDEHSFVDAVYDYLEALSNGQHSISEKESTDMLKSWSEQYLC